VYGFAGGDPVNFADPFGLCTLAQQLCNWIEGTSTALGLVSGFIAGGGGAALTGVGIVASPATAMAGATTGAAIGLAAGKAITGALFSDQGTGSGDTPSPRGEPKPSPNFETPTNAPSQPPKSLPEGHSVRVGAPTQEYPNGYWRQYNAGGQPVNPSTSKPPSNVTKPQFNAQTHVPLPPR
jgi:hypothetical protein